MALSIGEQNSAMLLEPFCPHAPHENDREGQGDARSGSGPSKQWSFFPLAAVNVIGECAVAGLGVPAVAASPGILTFGMSLTPREVKC